MEASREAVEKARADGSGRVYRVYCDGVFDLFHVGHALMFKQAKLALGAPGKTHLVAGVCDDETTLAHKGKTILDHATRCASCENCKWVDEVVPHAPWVITPEFLATHRIDFVAHDAIPYSDGATGAQDVYSYVKSRGMFLETQRTEGISTSDVLARIIRDYDSYVLRNIERGFTPEQLNLGVAYQAWLAERRNRRALCEALAKTTQEVASLGFGKGGPVGLALRLPSLIWGDFAALARYVNVLEYLPERVRRFGKLGAAIAAVTWIVRRTNLRILRGVVCPGGVCHR